VEQAIKATFQGELRFVGYADSSRGGPKVTFALADRDDLAQFIGLEGARFMAVLVRILDGEQPERGPAAAPAPLAAASKEPVGPLCAWSVARCREVTFRRWLLWACHPELFSDPSDVQDASEDEAKAALLKLCCVASRRELDTNAEAAARLHSAVRRPYLAWVGSNARATA